MGFEREPYSKEAKPEDVRDEIANVLRSTEADADKVLKHLENLCRLGYIRKPLDKLLVSGAHRVVRGEEQPVLILRA